MSKLILNPDVRVILVSAIVEGPLRSHVVRMILDTGATYTMLTPEILIEIGCDPALSQDRRSITTASGVEYVPFLKIPMIKTLDVKKENVEVCSHPLPPNLPARGLLGLNFLRHFSVHINFPQGFLEISGPSE